MKKSSIIIFCLGFSILLCSCMSTRYNAKYVYDVPFTSVEKLLSVKEGMSLYEVKQVLGISPFDIYHLQDNGEMILKYNYRVKGRKIPILKDVEKNLEYYHSEDYHTGGTDWYWLDPCTAYLHFKDDKFKSLITSEGIKNSERIMIIDGKIRIISKEEFEKLEDISLQNDLNNEGMSPEITADISTEKTESNLITKTSQELSSSSGAGAGTIIGGIAGTLLLGVLISQASK
jgi:hypothetical protein